LPTDPADDVKVVPAATEMSVAEIEIVLRLRSRGRITGAGEAHPAVGTRARLELDRPTCAPIRLARSTPLLPIRPPLARNILRPPWRVIPVAAIRPSFRIAKA